MIRLLLAGVLCAVSLTGSAAEDGFSSPLPAATRPMRFEAPPGGPLAFRGAVSVRPPFAAFGGLSGLAMETPDTAIGVSDKGRWLRLKLRIEGGRLRGVEEASEAPLLDLSGRPWPSGGRDAEGVARDEASGRLWVSFEGWHRLQAYDAPGGPSAAILEAPEWAGFSENGGLEALALAPDGALWAIREAAAGDEFPIWVGGAAGWSRKHLPRRGPFRPTDADFGPDGWLYVSERAFSFIGGFRFRLRRFRWGDGAAPVAEEEVLSFGVESYIDNIEAVTIWRRDDRTYLLIASDDNFFLLQHTVLAMYEVRG
ncbi:MAG: esterase-like activity of phytase family protein [Paracoccaceae bacterium]